MLKQKRIKLLLPLFGLLALTFIHAGCKTIEKAYKETKDEFFLRMGFEWFFVDYRDEGRIAIIWNNCNPSDVGPYAESWQELTYGIGDIGSERTTSRQAREFEGEMSQRISDIYNSRCVIDNNASISDATSFVRHYGRIDVNGSLASYELAVAETVGKLLTQYEPGPDIIPGNPLKFTVLVYLPQGPRQRQIDFSHYHNYYRYPLDPVAGNYEPIRDDMWDEMHDLLCGCYPNNHPIFENTLKSIIEGATRGESSEYGDRFTGGHNVCIHSKSYSAHQTGNVISDVSGNEHVFWYNVGPSFGLFEKRGDIDYASEANDWGNIPENCADGLHIEIAGIHYSEMCDEKPFWMPLNPLIPDYRNVLRSDIDQCIITSYQDCPSLYNHGSAITSDQDHRFMPRNYAPQGSMTLERWIGRGSSEDRLSCPPMMGIGVLSDHLPVHPTQLRCEDCNIDPDYDYRCIGAAQCDIFLQCCDRGHFELPSSAAASECYVTGMNTMVTGGPCYTYGNDETRDAIYDNLNTSAGGPRSLRILEARPNPDCNPDEYLCEPATHPSGNADVFYQAEHMEYYEGGAAAQDGGVVKPKAPKMLDEIYNCHECFPSECLACATCGDIEDPDLSQAAPDVSSSQLLYDGSYQECGGDPWLLGVHPANIDVGDSGLPVDNYDVIYINEDGYTCSTAGEHYNDYAAHLSPMASSCSFGDCQYRLSKGGSSVPLTLNFDFAHDDRHNDVLNWVQIQEQRVYEGTGLWNYSSPVSSAENLSRMATFNFRPNSLFSPHGQYRTLAGAWLRLRVNGPYDVVDDTGAVTGSANLPTIYRNVLFMKWRPGYPIPPKPLPYVNALSYDASPRAVNATVRELKMNVGMTIPGNGNAVSSPGVQLWIDDGDPDTVVTGEPPTFAGTHGWGWRYSSNVDWNVRNSFCRRWPNHTVCGCHVGCTSMPRWDDFGIEVRAFNGGNYFPRNYTVRVYATP